MTFLWPEMLWLLLLVPALIAGYFYLLSASKRPPCATQPEHGERGPRRGATCAATCRLLFLIALVACRRHGPSGRRGQLPSR